MSQPSNTPPIKPKYGVNVWTLSEGPDRGMVSCYTITSSATSNPPKRLDDDRFVAKFPVSSAHDEEFQRQNAKALCDYLNHRDAIIQKALSDGAFMEMLKGDHKPE